MAGLFGKFDDASNISVTSMAEFDKLESRLNTPARIRRRARMLEKNENTQVHSSKTNFTELSHVTNSIEKTESGKSHDRKILGPSNTRVNIAPKPEVSSGELVNVRSSLIAKTASLSSGHSNQNLGNQYHLNSANSKNVSSGSIGSIDVTEGHPSGISGHVKVNSSLSKINQKIKILATLLPDEILSDPISKKGRFYNTAVIFPDVSGFTQLCEKYDKTGKGGPSRLTEVLNGYLGSMIQIVLSRNGDVFKFGGDAFFCVWKVPLDADIKEIVYLAIESAVDIQKNCGGHNTDVGVKLGVKIAVAAGKAMFSIIGNKSRKHYVLLGPPVYDVRETESLCKSGDVIVSPSAWQYVENYMLYSYTYHSNNIHIRVHDFGPLWKPASVSRSIHYDSMSEVTSTRPSLKFISRLKVEDLRPFVLTPVMKSIHMNQSLDYLTEMRQVAIVFFNIVVDFISTPIEDLLQICHKVFLIISNTVDKIDGAVNKLTLFDKDIAILTVFGLKGFKHELVSQMALKCAYNCLELLKKLPVISAAAGVTTGMAYCGVIGHSLRKEYTVMGRPVNMAARLMCAYPNVVSSDRDSFLHSKLESSHFEVLEQKTLKGLDCQGPFYKFNLHLRRSKLKLDNSAYPLLGRAKEVAEFEKFLESAMTHKSRVNFLLIYGEARIGKSRLVVSFINIVEKLNLAEDKANVSKRGREVHNNIEINIISLTEDDSKSSYSACRLIFQQPLGLSDSSLVEEREDKIASKLGDIKDLYLLAALNPIFNVNFDLTPQYLSLSPQDQADAQRTLTKHLYTKCFPKGTKWMIVIEDAEFMDDESWIVMGWCSHVSYTVLYVFTIGQRRVLSSSAIKAISTFNHKKLVLSEIEKWYFSGMACQILGVSAIPVELENLMQKFKSSGNPGWLESFLLTLLQSGSVYIDQASSSEIKNLGLVSAPEEMLSLTPGTEDERNDNSNWMDCVENFESRGDIGSKKINVCLLGPQFYENIKNDTDLTMDTMFIKTIDGLKPLEQMVLKAGSVLGNNFRRTALKFLLAKDVTFTERLLAKAIKTLFEMKILTCAKGDLTHSNVMVPRRTILVTSIRKEVVCECTGIEIAENCTDFPQYASCGFMQFRSPIFRDTAYSLLLDDQKKKYHYSSIEFLRTNTTKCKFCQNVPFKNVIGNENKDEMVLVCNISPMHGVRSTRVDPKALFPVSSLSRKVLFCFYRRTNELIRSASQNVDAEFSRISGEVGDCQCSEILSSVYSILLEHSAASGRKDIILEVQLEYASLSLTTYNIPLTMQILEDALALVHQMKEDKEYPDFCTPYVFSKIYTLMGATKLCMGRPDNSLEFLELSLKYLKKSLPKSKSKLKFLIKRENLKRKMITEFFPERFVGTCSEEKASFADLLSECLGLVCIVNMYTEDWMMAKYASTLALNKALESNRNFFGLCTAYTNIIDVAYHYKDLNMCTKMEICAVDICKRCTKKIIEIYELEAICRLYRVIFQARHMRAEIDNAVFIGFQSIKIASTIRSASLRLDLMPDLIFALIQLNRLSEAASLLQELEFTSQLDSDKSSRIWYYGLCLDFQLDTGFTFIPYETCQLFVKEEEENFSSVRDPYSKHRLYASLWLWCIRHEEWELSKSYANTLKMLDVLEATETPATVFTRLKRLEGFLITLVHRMDTKHIHAITSITSEVHLLMSKLKKDTRVVTLLKPRYLLLKAYYRQIKYRDDSCFRVLNKALSLADKMNDKNTSEWINHLKMVWSNTISPIQRDYWTDHCRYNLIDWHESNGSTRKQSFMYSLPLPKF